MDRKKRKRRIDVDRQVSKEMLVQLRMKNLILDEAFKLECERVKRKEQMHYVR